MRIHLSFIVPVFNSGDFLQEAVDSIRAQTTGLIEAEIVMVDDCSTDAATLRIIDTLAAQPSTRSIRQARNAGPAAARNAGLKAASGDWITFLDSDDVLAPGAIRARLEVLQALPDATWLMGDIYRVTAPGRLEDGDFPAFREGGRLVLPGVIEHAAAIEVLLKSARVPQVGTAMIRRDVIERIGGFDASLRYSEDWLYWLTLALTERLYWMQMPTLHLRRYNDSMTKNRLADACAGPLAPAKALKDTRFTAFKKPLRWRLAQEWRRYSSVHLAHGMHAKAAIGALRALRWVPNDVRNFRALRAALRRTPGV